MASTTAVVMLVFVSSLLGNTMSSNFEKTMEQPCVPLLLTLGSIASAVASPGSQNVLFSASTYSSAKHLSNHFSSQSSTPSLNVDVVKLEEREEEFDMAIREAKFAFRFTDLGSAVGINADNDPKMFQHWALVVHFPRGKKTYLFEAWKDESNGLLQPTRAEYVDYKVFAYATYFATIKTSPHELLMKAKQVPTGHYDVLVNNCQTWLKDFLGRVSPELLIALHDKVPETKTVRGTIIFPVVDGYLRSIDQYLRSIGRIFLGLML